MNLLSIFSSAKRIPRYWNCLLSLSLWLVVSHLAWSAPYPKEGKLIEWVQPDGTPLTLRVFGDEFYGRTTTKDGYTVIFDAADRTYYYAETNQDGKSLISSDAPAHREHPGNLAKHLKEPKEKVVAVRTANVTKFAPDRAANWAKRVKAVQAKRASAALQAPTEEGIPPSEQAGQESLLAAPINGSKVGLVILVQFPDDPATAGSDPVTFPTTQAKIERYCNQVGYSDDGNSGSIRDYFSAQSNGQLTHTQAVTAIVTLPHPRNYYNYSDYPSNLTLPDSGVAGRKLVTDAITKLKTDGFNFSTLTVNSSNRVLATSLLFAGNNSGVWSKGLWPHAYATASPISVGTVNNPRFIYSYQCTDVPDASPVIGTVCHELGHLLLDYPDLYDYGSDSAGAGDHCLMSGANHLNGGKTPGPIDLYLKDFSGWATITDVTAAQMLDVSLPSTGNVGYRIRKPGTATEYFLVENRGTGDLWANFSPDKGIAIWHIDENVSGNNNQQMTSSLHYQVSLEQADGLFDLENNRDSGDSADLFDNGGLFSNGTNPNADWWDGTPSGISISVLSAAGASMNVRFGAAISSTTLALNPVTQDVTAAGMTTSFAVTSNTTWTWSKDATWVTSSENTSQTGDQTFSYTVAANTSSTSRTAVITLTGGSLTRTHTITQAGANLDDHGNNTASATVIGQNSTTGGNIETFGDNDYFRINVASAGTLLLETTGTTDTFGYLLNSSGTELIFNDDDGESSNFRLSSVVTAGTYYVRVKHYNPTEGVGNYQLVSTLTTGALTLALTPTTQSAVASAATHSFTVTSNTAWSWSVDAAWVTSAEITNQTGDQTFTYDVAANNGTASRTAVITLIGASVTRTHTITQSGGSADDHGNTTATATVVAVNSTTAGNMETAGDNDYFRINVTGNGSLTLSTTSAIDTFGHLLDSAGNQLAEDDDAGVDTNFLINYSLSAGTYYVRVRHYSATGIGNYQFVSSFQATDDHGNAITTATLITQNSTTAGNIETPGDNDYFRINVTSSGTLVLETTSAIDTFGHLLDSTGSELAFNDDDGVGNNFLISYTLSAGTYYVRVRLYEPADTGSYQLLSTFTPSATPRQIYDAVATGAGLSGLNAQPSAIPHQDGTKNLLKYAFNMNLAGPDVRVLTATTGTAGLPKITLEGSSAAAMLKVEFLRRKGSGLVYTAKRSSTMALGSFLAMTATPTVTSIDENWERVVILESANPATTTRSFVRVEVELP